MIQNDILIDDESVINKKCASPDRKCCPQCKMANHSRSNSKLCKYYKKKIKPEVCSKCQSSSHLRVTSKLCPFNKKVTKRKLDFTNNVANSETESLSSSAPKSKRSLSPALNQSYTSNCIEDEMENTYNSRSFLDNGLLVTPENTLTNTPVTVKRCPSCNSTSHFRSSSKKCPRYKLKVI